MKKTQNALKQNGNIGLHKIRSNSSEVLSSFPREDLSEDALCVDFTDPVRSLKAIQHVTRRELHTFCDASKEVIGVVTYVKLYTADGQMTMDSSWGSPNCPTSYHSTVGTVSCGS